MNNNDLNDLNRMKKYGHCYYCKRYIGSGYIALEHKKLCKNVSPEVREIHSGIKQRMFELIKIKL